MATSVENIIKMIRILQNEDCVSGQELAYRIGVSVKTIQKYKQDLDQMHIFVETKKGRYGGYYLDKTVLEIHSALSDEEQEALANARTYIERDLNFPRPLETMIAIDKVIQNERMASSARKKVYLANSDGQGFSGGFERIKLDKIQAAITDQRILYIEYESDISGLTERVIHPYGLMKMDGKFMILAFCEQRGEVSLFGVEKIRHLAAMKYTFKAPEGIEIKWNRGIRVKESSSKKTINK